jgi:chromosome segregation ATPase
VIDLAVAEALRAVAAQLGEVSAFIESHAQTSSERHGAILREVAHVGDQVTRLTGDVARLAQAPGDLAEARRQIDTEASIARVRTEAETAVAEALRSARADASRAEADAQAARAELAAARARQSAARAAWGLLGDTLRSVGRWATSTTGAASIAAVLGAGAAALAHWLLAAAGAPQ